MMALVLCQTHAHPILINRPTECDHHFMQDEWGFFVCTECGYVDEENFSQTQHFVTIEDRKCFAGSPMGCKNRSTTMIGTKSERLHHFHRLAKLHNHTSNSYFNDCEIQFRLYLSQIEVPVTFDDCWREFTRIHPHIPYGKGKWCRLICAIVILDCLRKRLGPVVRIRPILAKWEINRGDFFAALRAVQVKIKTTSYASTHRKSEWNQEVKNYFLSLSHAFHIDHEILALAQRLVLSKRLINRIEIQAAGAILAANEILADQKKISIRSILNYFRPISLERMYALKKIFLERWQQLEPQSPRQSEMENTRESIVEMKIATVEVDQSEPIIVIEAEKRDCEPRQPMLPPYRKPNPTILRRRKIMILICIYEKDPRSDYPFYCQFIILIFYRRGIGILDQMFPPPHGWRQ